LIFGKVGTVKTGLPEGPTLGVTGISGKGNQAEKSIQSLTILLS